MKNVLLGTAITTVGILAYHLFGRVDTMAGLFLIAVLVIWECRSPKERLK